VTEAAHPPGDAHRAAAARGSQRARPDAVRGPRAGDRFVAKATDPSSSRSPNGRTVSFGLRESAGLLFAALAAAGTVLAWRGAERSALAAARAECDALLGVVASGVESSIAASAAVETLLGERLTDDARAVAGELARSPGLEEDVLRAAVERRGLAGAAALDPELGPVAACDAPDAPAADAAEPFATGRLARLGLESMVDRLRAAGLGTRSEAVVGFEDGPFGARAEFAVAVACPELPGYVVVRADAARMEAFRRDAGIARVLREAAAAPGVASLALVDADGTCLAAADPGLVGATLPDAGPEPRWRLRADGRRALDVAMPVRWGGGAGGRLLIELEAGPVEDVIARTRRDVALVAGLAVLAGLGGIVALAAVERRRRAAESALRDERAQRETFSSMGRMAAGVAHEIRGPLNALALNAQLLEREARLAPPARITELTRSIRDAVGRADASVREFLSLGRGGAEVDRRDVDLADVVRDALASEGGPLRTEPPEAPVVVAGDARLLARAVANLVRNARQAAPPESVRVSWRRERTEAVLDVDDAGPGIPPARRAEVFLPFRSGRVGGTGLGLTLASDAVERHGGRIEILDAPGGGARLRVRLPAEPLA
jgi:signal transduction histidine kinase